MKKTKIVCTLGPATDKEGVLEELILNGLNTARFNFSHGSHEEHLTRINKLKEVREKLNTSVGLLLDTKGPEIRLGKFENYQVELVKNQKFILTTDEISGNEISASISFKDLPKDVITGSIILIDDGKLELEVEKTDEKNIYCIVKNGGSISNNKSINVPNISLSLPALTEKDIADLKFGVDNDFDYVAASFVRSKDDVLKIREVLDGFGGQSIKIISKIENQQGIDNFEEILEVTDGIMVARGDLGVEIPIQNLPSLQKKMIKKCIKKGKTVITATQMLDSMMKSPFPTRAEVSDVANAVYDCSGAIMLSGETACGSYPIESLKMMKSIAEQSESDIDYWKRFRKIDELMLPNENTNLKDKETMRKQLGYAVCNSAQYTNARAIVVVSEGGETPRTLVKFRPKCPIYVLTANKKTYSQMALEWNTYPIYIENEYDFDTILNKGINKLKEENLLNDGDIIILSGGVTLSEINKDYLTDRSVSAIIQL